MNKKKVWSWVPTIYYAQGLPFSIIRQMAVVFFKDQGVSLKSLGLVSLYGAPWTFKFVWSPIVDTISSKRRWILAMEAVIFAILMTIFGFLFYLNGGIQKSDVHLSLGSVQIVAFLFLIMASFAATQDIAIDGFYLESLVKNEQARYSGWCQAAYRFALITGTGILIALAGHSGWTVTFGAAAGIFAMLFVWHFFMLPTQIPEVLNSNLVAKAERQRFLDGFQAFLKLPGIGKAIAFIFLFKFGDALLFGMSSPFLLDAGMNKQQLGLYSGVFGITAALLATLSGGWMVSRFGLSRMLWIFGSIQNLAIPVYAAAAYFKVSIPWLAGALVVEQIAAGWGAAVYANFLMRQNDPRFRATHYAIVTGLMSFTVMIGGTLSGLGAAHFGYTKFFLIAFAASIPGMLLIPMIARRPECQ